MIDGRPAAARMIGRSAECRVLDDLVARVQRGHGQALVLSGDAGIGKTALLDHAARRAGSGMRVLRVTGIQTEMELAFAGLHQLLGAAVERADRLQPPRSSALRVAFRLEDGPAPDRLTIALGVLELLSDLAADRPLLCLVDDVQWLDTASVQALSFAARRIEAAPAGFVLATRRPGPDLSGIAALHVPGLGAPDARALLEDALPFPLDDEIREQIVTETGGNPLALLELPRSVSPSELAGGFALPAIAPLSERIEAGYRRRLSALPADAQRAVLLAAADPVGDPALLRAAAAHLGLRDDAVAEAAATGLLTTGSRVSFTHSVARSAVYRSAAPDARRDVHRALALATDEGTDPDRRAWHRALATAGPDEDVAEQLESSARRARARGGVGAAAAFLERAASLTPAAGARIDRLIAAAALTQNAGDVDHAEELLDVAARAGSVSGEQQARIALARGQVAFAAHRGAESVELLIDAAHRLKQYRLPENPATVLEAVLAATWVVPRPENVDLVKAAVAALAEGGPADPGVDLLIEGVRASAEEGYGAAAPVLRRALDVVLADDRGSVAAGLATLWFLLCVPVALWDEDSWDALLAGETDLARRTGGLCALNGTTRCLVVRRVLIGDLDGAEQAVGVMDAIASATGKPPTLHAQMVLSAWRGDEETTLRLNEDLRAADEPGRRSGSAHHLLGMGAVDGLFADYSMAVLNNSLGRFAVAHGMAATLFEIDDLTMGPLFVPELAEAAARTGAVEDLLAAREWVELRARLAPTPWCLGIAARVRALAEDGDRARRHYLDSIEHLGRSAMRMELARSHLLFGEWLRRHGGRGEARQQLRAANEMFEAVGAAGFAARSARELRALGDKASSVEGGGALTAQERNVADMAADGMTNPEIATRLFLSPRTVQYHLRKVFIKLAVTSRVELKQALQR